MVVLLLFKECVEVETCVFSSLKVTFQYVLWDRFKVLDSMTPANRSNLCRLCSHLITSRALSLAILRVSPSDHQPGTVPGHTQGKPIPAAQ